MRNPERAQQGQANLSPVGVSREHQVYPWTCQLGKQPGTMGHDNAWLLRTEPTQHGVQVDHSRQVIIGSSKHHRPQISGLVDEQFDPVMT